MVRLHRISSDLFGPQWDWLCAYAEAPSWHVDLLTDPTHTQPAEAALLSGEFLVVAGHGDVYSDAQVSGWLQKTGWRPVETKPFAGPTSLLVAEAV
jgi:hypothetical protein